MAAAIFIKQNLQTFGIVGATLAVAQLSTLVIAKPCGCPLGQASFWVGAGPTPTRFYKRILNLKIQHNS